MIPDLETNGIPLDKVKNFNFLGLQLNENMSWKPHIDSLSNKLAKCAGVLSRLKRFLPAHADEYFSPYYIETWRRAYTSVNQIVITFGERLDVPLMPSHSLN